MKRDARTALWWGIALGLPLGISLPLVGLNYGLVTPALAIGVWTFLMLRLKPATMARD